MVIIFCCLEYQTAKRMMTKSVYFVKSDRVISPAVRGQNTSTPGEMTWSPFRNDEQLTIIDWKYMKWWSSLFCYTLLSYVQIGPILHGRRTLLWGVVTFWKGRESQKAEHRGPHAIWWKIERVKMTIKRRRRKFGSFLFFSWGADIFPPQSMLGFSYRVCGTLLKISFSQ